MAPERYTSRVTFSPRYLETALGFLRGSLHFRARCSETIFYAAFSTPAVTGFEPATSRPDLVHRLSLPALPARLGDGGTRTQDLLDRTSPLYRKAQVHLLPEFISEI